MAMRLPLLCPSLGPSVKRPATRPDQTSPAQGLTMEADDAHNHLAAKVHALFLDIRRELGAHHDHLPAEVRRDRHVDDASLFRALNMHLHHRLLDDFLRAHRRCHACVSYIFGCRYPHLAGLGRGAAAPSQDHGDALTWVPDLHDQAAVQALGGPRRSLALLALEAFERFQPVPETCSLGRRDAALPLTRDELDAVEDALLVADLSASDRDARPKTLASASWTELVLELEPAPPCDHAIGAAAAREPRPEGPRDGVPDYYLARCRDDARDFWPHAHAQPQPSSRLNVVRLESERCDGCMHKGVGYTATATDEQLGGKRAAVQQCLDMLASPVIAPPPQRRRFPAQARGDSQAPRPAKRRRTDRFWASSAVLGLRVDEAEVDPSPPPRRPADLESATVAGGTPLRHESTASLADDELGDSPFPREDGAASSLPDKASQPQGCTGDPTTPTPSLDAGQSHKAQSPLPSPVEQAMEQASPASPSSTKPSPVPADAQLSAPLHSSKAPVGDDRPLPAFEEERDPVRPGAGEDAVESRLSFKLWRAWGFPWHTQKMRSEALELRVVESGDEPE